MISSVGSRPTTFSTQNVTKAQDCCGPKGGQEASQGGGTCGDKFAKDSFDKGGCGGKSPMDLKGGCGQAGGCDKAGGKDEQLSPEQLIQMLMELMQKSPDIAQQLLGDSGAQQQQVASV